MILFYKDHPCLSSETIARKEPFRLVDRYPLPPPPVFVIKKRQKEIAEVLRGFR
jgi:hypothetical protein